MVRLPTSADDLPPWVLDLLGDLGGRAVETHALEQNVTGYLEWFREHGGSGGISPTALYLLRAINWGELPLWWRPVFLKNFLVLVSERQSADAQRQLIRRMGEDLQSDPEAITDALDAMHSIVGVSQAKRRRPAVDQPAVSTGGQGL